MAVTIAKLANLKSLACAGLLAVSMAFAGSATAQVTTLDRAPSDAGLAAAALSEGESLRAISMLRAELEEYPGDPALLINLGIAYAQNGNVAEARANFEAAMSGREMTELETANGTTTDSRRLARRALAMLDRGEFRPANAQAEQFTLNR